MNSCLNSQSDLGTAPISSPLTLIHLKNRCTSSKVFSLICSGTDGSIPTVFLLKALFMSLLRSVDEIFESVGRGMVGKSTVKSLISIGIFPSVSISPLSWDSKIPGPVSIAENLDVLEIEMVMVSVNVDSGSLSFYKVSSNLTAEMK